eukprot:scaffold30108_cov48-Attheya_sp.AAC.4
MYYTLNSARRSPLAETGIKLDERWKPARNRGTTTEFPAIIKWERPDLVPVVSIFYEYSDPTQVTRQSNDRTAPPPTRL